MYKKNTLKKRGVFFYSQTIEIIGQFQEKMKNL